MNTVMITDKSKVRNGANVTVPIKGNRKVKVIDGNVLVILMIKKYYILHITFLFLSFTLTFHYNMINCN